MPTALQPPATRRPVPPGAALRVARCLWVAAAVWLVACVHNPQAAVAAAAAEGPALRVGLAHTTACQGTPAAHTALQRMADELQAQGLALQATCQASNAGWVVQVWVVDGMKARQVVRGPLADGQGVDMGTPPGLALVDAPASAHGFSPDVLHNRQWLRALMARYQFDNLPDAWWHFSQRGGVPAQAEGADLAAR